MKKSEALQIIANQISQCTLCDELVQLRKDYNYHTVPGEGFSNADIMIIGEAPGEDEAKSGRPFVGRAGKLLDKIIAAAGWDRTNVFIANTIKCRPPKNRDPQQEEANNCRKWLDLQIRCIDPKWIICLGRISSRYLLGYGEEVKMSSLRGVHNFDGRKVLCTYHPSYLLRTPSAKEHVWQDLQVVIQDLKV